MKKYLFIALASMTVCVAACSKQDAQSAAPLEPWVLDETLPVPIQFSQGDLFSVQTRAGDTEPITDVDDAVFAVLAVPKVSHSSTAAADFAAVTDLKQLPLKGVKAQSASGTVKFYDGSDERTYYYPQQGSNETRIDYSFYAYRTAADGATSPVAALEDSHLKTHADFTLEPVSHNIDVLWSKSAATMRTYSTVDYYGFNAEYIRRITANSEFTTYQPKLQFSHSAACLKFVIKAENAAAEDALAKGATDNYDFKVRNLKIKGLYTDVTLDLTNGQLTPAALATPSTSFVHVVDGGKTISPIEETPSEPYGYVFIAPGKNSASLDLSDTDYAYTPLRSTAVEIEFQTLAKDADGDTDEYWVTKTATLPYPKYLSTDYGAYLHGVCYTYNIIVKSPVAIEIKAAVTSFTDFGGSYLGGVVSID